jgi:hypothetical protein
MDTARDLLGKREANMKRLEKEAPNLSLISPMDSGNS